MIWFTLLAPQKKNLGIEFMQIANAWCISDTVFAHILLDLNADFAFWMYPIDFIVMFFL